MANRTSTSEGATLRRLERLGRTPMREDILYFLSTQDPGEVSALYTEADRVRRGIVGDEIHLRAIIEFSNHCFRNCRYCGIRRDFPGVTRYRMRINEVVEAAAAAVGLGYRTVVLQSGEDGWFTADRICRMVAGIKALGDVAVTLAVGERPAEEFRAFLAAGADRYLLKHETSDPDLYARLNPGMTLARRIGCLRELKTMGFQTGSGIMIGLPGQTLASLAGDILLFKELDLDMIGCGPYIPVSGCSTDWSAGAREELSFRVLAVNRLVLRNTHLPSTTALSTLNENDARALALQRGANVVMPNLTPERYRRFYEIYPSKKRIEVDNRAFRAELEALAVRLGRTISSGRGDRPGWSPRTSGV